MFGRGCREAGIAVSMGSKGDCFDNAVIESFWATVKKEIGLTTGRKFATRDQARRAIFEYIETFYNPRRRHSTLSYRSPIEHEQLYAERALTPVR